MTAATQAPLIDVRGLYKSFGRHRAVSDLSLDLRPGEVIGLVGANGGGKTTSLRLIGGVLKPDRGTGTVLGMDVDQAAGRLAARIGYMPQRAALYENLTISENLLFRARIYGLPNPRAAVQEALGRYGLTERRTQRAGTLSGGWLRRLQMAAALIHDPDLLLLDEPSAGLDMAARQDIWRRIAALAAEGAGIVIATHDLADAERCHRICVFNRGAVQAQGTPEALIAATAAKSARVEGGARLEGRLAEAGGIYDAYRQGAGWRVLYAPEAEAPLQSLVAAGDGTMTPSPLRLEDAIFLLARDKAETEHV